MVVREAVLRGDRDARVCERREELAGIGDAGKGERPPPRQFRGGRADRFETAREHRKPAPLRLTHDPAGALACVAHNQDGMRAVELRGKRRAQRTRRDHISVADAAPAVQRHEGHVFDERRVLQAVIHHDEVGLFPRGGGRAGDAVARNDGRRDAGEQQRLVADLRRAGAGADAHGADQRAAVTAREKRRAQAGAQEEARDRDRGRRLATAADRQIADADDGHGGARAAAAHPRSGDGPVESR